MISIISDVHIKTPGDKPFELFMKFIEDPQVKNSQKIILLGDIFDLLIGGDRSFLNEHQQIFNAIDELLKNGKEVYYIEGNHDFHIESLLNKRFPSKNFHFSRGKVLINYEGLKYLFCHGDDIEIENPSYKRYYRFIRSNFIKFLAEKVVPFFITRNIGVWASAKSRKKNIKEYESKKELIKDKFRRSAETFYKEEAVDFIVCGHSHVKDLYESNLGFTYINNGYFPQEQEYIYLENGKATFNGLAGPSR